MIAEQNCTIIYSSTCTEVDFSDCTTIVSSSTNFCLEITDPNLWTLYFHGSRKKEEAGDGCLLINPHGNKMMLACRMEFDCMNKVVEYKALVQGLRTTLDLQIKCIEVFGDSQVVIRHVRDSIHHTSHHLNNYQWEVWDLMNKFKAFNIISIPRSMNFEADMMANVASNPSPSDEFTSDNFFVELIYRLSIPKNITNWRIFDDDEHIINFLHSKDTFKGLIIDDEQHESLLQASTSEDKPEYNNTMPKNIVRLEKLFDIQDNFKRLTNTKKSSSSLRYEVVNLSTEQNPQTINLGKNCTHTERVSFMNYSKNIRMSSHGLTRISRLTT